MAYATRAKIKEYLGIPSAVTTDDTMLDDMILAATDVINEFTGGQYELLTVIRYFDTPEDPMKLIIPEADLIEIFTLTNGDGTVLTTTHYDLYPYNETPYREIRIKPTQAVYYFKPKDGYNPHKAISIAGTWGVSAVPNRIRQACMELVAHYYRARFGDAGEVQLTTSGGIMRVPGGIPKHIKELLVGDRSLF